MPEFSKNEPQAFRIGWLDCGSQGERREKQDKSRDEFRFGMRILRALALRAPFLALFARSGDFVSFSSENPGRNPNSGISAASGICKSKAPLLAKTARNEAA